MITIKANSVRPDGSKFIESDFQICTNWNDVNLRKLLAPTFDNNGNPCEPTFKHELKALSTLDHKIIDLSTDLQLFPLYTLISFIYDLNTIPILKAGPIQRNTYDQLELTKIVVSKGKPYARLLRAGMIYYPELKNPIQLIGLGADISNQLVKFLGYYKEMTDGEVDTIKELAGIHKLTAFGPWATAYAMAERDVFKLKEIFKLPAIEVYTTLLFNFREAEYQKKYWEFKHPPKT